MKSLALAGMVGWLVVSGCNRGAESPEAVRQAIVEHLRQRSDLNVALMQIDVVSVEFRRDAADAVVAFRPKGASGGPGMTMNYQLERKGSGWVVKGRADNAGSPHGAMGGTSADLPLGHPPMGSPPPPATKK